MNAPKSQSPHAIAEPLSSVARSRIDWTMRARASLQQTERYTQFVVIAKRGLLIAAAIVLLAVIAYSLQPRQQNQTTIAQLTSDHIQIVGNDLTMTKPRLTGVDEEGDPYIVTAELAIQDRRNAKQARLKNVQADVTLKDGTWMSETSPGGFLDASKKLLTLTGPIAIFSDNGYEAHTMAANIDMDTGMITGNRAVDGQGPLGTFRADTFKIDREKKLIYLHNNVRMTIYGHVTRKK